MIRLKDNNTIEFIFDYPADTQVYLVGDFNQWNEKSHPLKFTNGQWKLELTLPPGQYEFKYLCGHLWYNDYSAHKYVPNPWGGENSVVIVNN